MANSSQADDYADGNGDTVPSRYDKWNTDVALGWTPDEDTLVEFTAGRGDGFARYAGRGMDGSQFSARALACVSRRPTLARASMAWRHRSTTTTPITSWTATACAILCRR